MSELCLVAYPCVHGALWYLSVQVCAHRVCYTVRHAQAWRGWGEYIRRVVRAWGFAGSRPVGAKLWQGHAWLWAPAGAGWNGGFATLALWSSVT